MLRLIEGNGEEAVTFDEISEAHFAVSGRALLPASIDYDALMFSLHTLSITPEGDGPDDLQLWLKGEWGCVATNQKMNVSSVFVNGTRRTLIFLAKKALRVAMERSENDAPMFEQWRLELLKFERDTRRLYFIESKP